MLAVALWRVPESNAQPRSLDATLRRTLAALVASQHMPGATAAVSIDGRRLPVFRHAYLIAGLVLDRVAKRTYYDELLLPVLSPLRLDATSPSNRADLAGLPQGHIVAPVALAATIGKMMVATQPPNAPYEFGIFVRETPDGAIYSHPGGFPGYRTEVAYSAKLGVGVAFQANYSAPGGSSAIPLLLDAVRSGLDTTKKSPQRK